MVLLVLIFVPLGSIDTLETYYVDLGSTCPLYHDSTPAVVIVSFSSQGNDGEKGCSLLLRAHSSPSLDVDRQYLGALSGLYFIPSGVIFVCIRLVCFWWFGSLFPMGVCLALDVRISSIIFSKT